jgi:hypothetical protein
MANTDGTRTHGFRFNCVALVLAAVAVGACGSSSFSSSSKSAVDTVSREDALSNVIDQIDAGPSWETPEMSAAVHANLVGKSGANDGCAWLYNGQAQKIPGFACYLEYVDPSDPDADPTTGVVEVYFNADGNGKHIHPISAATYSNETIGPTGPESTTTATTGATSTATTSTSSASSTGTAPAQAVGSYSGVAPASPVGPATDQSVCPGVAATIGPNTSCGFAANVVNVVQQAYAATGHYPAHVTAHSPATGGTYVLSCNTANPSASGTPAELDCSTGTGGEVTIGLPLPGQ